MITTDELAEVFAKYNPGATPDVVKRRLIEDPEFAAILEGVAKEIWWLGYEAGRPKPLTAAEKVDIARPFLSGSDTMGVIDATERRLLGVD